MAPTSGRKRATGLKKAGKEEPPDTDIFQGFVHIILVMVILMCFNFYYKVIGYWP